MNQLRAKNRYDRIMFSVMCRHEMPLSCIVNSVGGGGGGDIPATKSTWT